MSILDIFRGRKESPAPPKSVPVDRDDSGDKIYSDDIVSMIHNEVDRRRADRSVYELQWTLNANFLAGNQNIDIDPVGNRLVEEASVEIRDNERQVFNRVAPLMDTRQANLKSVHYDMVVNPRTDEADDEAKAKVSTKLLQYDQDRNSFQAQVDKLISWSELCGTAFTLSWWDKNAGDKVATCIQQIEGIDGEGNPCILEIPQDVHSGDVSFGLLSAYEVFPDSLEVQEVADQHDIITEQVLDIETIKDVYGVDVDPTDCETYQLTPVPTGTTGHGRQNTVLGVSHGTRGGCEKVLTYYENPSKAHPRGRLIIVIADKIAFYGELPGGIMPIVAFKAKIVPGLFYGKSVIQELIPLQRAYNRIENKILDYIHTTANAPWLTPEGSIDVDEIEAAGGIESGSIIEYNPALGKPDIVSYPNPPSILSEKSARIASDMEYTAGVSQLMVYGSAASNASGAALDTRREIDMTRMSLTADNIRNGIIEMAKIWLKLNKEFSTGYRTMLIAGGNDIGSVFAWCADDINSFDVKFSAENELRHSKDKQREDFLQLYQLGLYVDDNGQISREFKRKMRELYSFGNLEDLNSLDDLQENNAKRENYYFAAGAVPSRYKYDDDAIHLEQHLRYALSAEFRKIRERSPELCELFDQHIEEHRAQIQQAQQMAQQTAQQNALQQMAMQQQIKNNRNGG